MRLKISHDKKKKKLSIARKKFFSSIMKKKKKKQLQFLIIIYKNKKFANKHSELHGITDTNRLTLSCCLCPVRFGAQKTRVLKLQYRCIYIYIYLYTKSHIHFGLVEENIYVYTYNKNDTNSQSTRLLRRLSYNTRLFVYMYI